MERTRFESRPVVSSDMTAVTRKWRWIAGFLAVAILYWIPLSHLVSAVRLALSVQSYAEGETGSDLGVQESKISRHLDSRDYEALLYRPAKSKATGAVVVMPGISELGCYHPRLIAFSRFLADRGLMVITPDVQEFRNFQITAEPINQILFWHSQVRTLAGGESIKKVGLAGISFSGTLALMAASKPEIRDSVAFVAAIGPYYSLHHCTGNWFSSEPEDSRGKNYPTKFYARWIVMLSALNLVSETRDRSFLHDALIRLLLHGIASPASPGLTSEGLRWYKLATMRAGPSDQDLAREIEDYLVARIHPHLDPKEALDKVRCPVFLIHGAYDDLISPEESSELHRRIPHSYLLVSPFLTHTHPNAVPLSFRKKAEAVMDTLIFCYRFSMAIR